jgi:hypothetical protein
MLMRLSSPYGQAEITNLLHYATTMGAVKGVNPRLTPWLYLLCLFRNNINEAVGTEMIKGAE